MQDNTVAAPKGWKLRTELVNDRFDRNATASIAAEHRPTAGVFSEMSRKDHLYEQTKLCYNRNNIQKSIPFII